MAIESYDPLIGNYVAGAKYVAACSQIAASIDDWFARYRDAPVEEPGILGFVIALRGAFSSATRPHEFCVGTKRVKSWKDQYSEWFHRYGSKIKVRRGIDRAKLLQIATEEFDNLLAVMTAKDKQQAM